jgi:hypothetical protein
MKPAVYASVALLGAVLLIACKKENRLDCFTPNGEDTSETRTLSSFDSVEVFDKIDLVVHPGLSHSVVVTGGKKILHNIKTDVRGGRLFIDNRNTCNFVRGYKRHIKVDVYMPYLKFLKNSGVGPATISGDRVQDTLVVRAENSGDIIVDGTYTELRTSTHGNGDVYLHGSSKRLFVYTYGTNYVHGEKITIKEYAFIHSLTLGDCIINADSLNELECNIEGPGNIYYTGHPAVFNDFSDKDQYSGRVYPKD